MGVERPGIDIFDRDARANTGYLYTHTNRLSCKLATKRTTDAILETGEFSGRTILDLACGDAFYSIQFWDRSHPRRLVAADGSVKRGEGGGRKQRLAPHFSFGKATRILYLFVDNSFDLVLMQSVLHHDDNPSHMIREAFRIAPRVLIHEPNGNNIGLKIIEKTSRYHLEHGEKSYSSRRMKRWIEDAGGSAVYTKTAGFVPMFCSDWLARTMKLVEPAVEWVPLFRWMACAVYVMVGVRKPT